MNMGLTWTTCALTYVTVVAEAMGLEEITQGKHEAVILNPLLNWKKLLLLWEISIHETLKILHIHTHKKNSLSLSINCLVNHSPQDKRNIPLGIEIETFQEQERNSVPETKREEKN